MTSKSSALCSFPKVSLHGCAVTKSPSQKRRQARLDAGHTHTRVQGNTSPVTANNRRGQPLHRDRRLGLTTEAPVERFLAIVYLTLSLSSTYPRSLSISRYPTLEASICCRPYPFSTVPLSTDPDDCATALSKLPKTRPVVIDHHDHQGNHRTINHQYKNYKW